MQLSSRVAGVARSQHSPTRTIAARACDGGADSCHHDPLTCVSVSSQYGPAMAKRIFASMAAFSCALLFATVAHADTFRWPQPGGPGTPVVLTYSFSNLLDQGLSGGLSETDIRASTAEAFGVWSHYVPLHFIERSDSGPSPTDRE